MRITQEELYVRVGGRPGIMEVMKLFYDKIYADPWLKLFFSVVSQEHIENQQADFMTSCLGGPKKYCGRLPIPAHEHVFVTEELFQARSKILRESLDEAGLDPSVVEAWIKVDDAFKQGMVKSSMSECKKRFFTDEILNFKIPMQCELAV